MFSEVCVYFFKLHLFTGKVWYRHSGQPPIGLYELPEVSRANRPLNMIEIKSDVGSNHITHLDIVDTFPEIKELLEQVATGKLVSLRLHFDEWSMPTHLE